MYFDSKNQINGDNAYNDGKLDLALKHYQRGLAKLRKTVQTDKSLKHKVQFLDACTYAQADILSTQAERIQQFIETTKAAPKITDVLESLIRFKPTPSELLTQIDAMASNWTEITEILQMKGSCKTKQKRMDELFSTLAMHLEDFSDLLIDSNEELSFEIAKADDSDLVTRYHNCHQKNLNDAVELMALSQVCQLKAKKPIETESHIGFFYLLLQQYNLTQDKRSLTRLENELIRHKLLERDNDDLHKLEFITYALLIENELNRQPNVQLITQGEQLIASINGLENNQDAQIQIDEFTAQKEKSLKRLPAHPIAPSPAASSSDSHGASRIASSLRAKRAIGLMSSVNASKTSRSSKRPKTPGYLPVAPQISRKALRAARRASTPALGMDCFGPRHFPSPFAPEKHGTRTIVVPVNNDVPVETMELFRQAIINIQPECAKHASWLLHTIGVYFYYNKGEEPLIEASARKALVVSLFKCSMHIFPSLVTETILKHLGFGVPLFVSNGPGADRYEAHFEQAINHFTTLLKTSLLNDDQLVAIEITALFDFLIEKMQTTKLIPPEKTAQFFADFKGLEVPSPFHL